MSIAVYQDVLCRMVAGAELRKRIAASPDEELRGYDLTERERRRLRAIAQQKGLAVSGAIHRANRLLPLHQALPYTCLLLGAQLRETVDRYWRDNPVENLQLPGESERFAEYLTAEIEAGRVSAGEFLEEVLAFERAATELRFFGGAGRAIRMVRFRHDPVPLLEALARRETPGPGIEAGEFHLLIDCRKGEPEFRLLDEGAAAALAAIEDDTEKS
ncbi:MAG: hypothetical protein R2762_18875 [Bryobacteraceae bacterium]